MPVPDYTIVCAVDARTIDQLRLVWPTWRRHKPELLDHEMLLICDGTPETLPEWERRLEWLDHPKRFLTMWSWGLELTQRERMLTAFVHVPPRLVSTPYWLKIDTDAVASGPQQWVKEKWFANKPALIASPWGYTKPAWMLYTIEEWADSIPELASHPRLGFVPTEPDQETYHYSRIGSWLCFFDTEFTRQVAKWVPGRLPVPSEDTYHWYCALRLQREVVKVKFKNLGWSNWHTTGTRTRMVAEAMRQDVMYC